ncbi:MAG: ABC transporter permease [Succinatimonas sp.]|jgi:ABC-2 type transport system permease protein|nr:ABC transporter permease [Succinatimonas sp.]MDD5868264.1 ABC transporter permease [Succinatimonas sp.]MDY5722443.1 ABC transporter permease [Succinivibrio sp.]
MFKYLVPLLKKEVLQTLKDKSVFMLVFLLPIILVIIYGSAIRMEIKPVKLGLVSTNVSVLEREITQEFLGSDYYELTVVPTFIEGQKLLDDNKVKALVYVPHDLSTQIKVKKAQIMIYLNGVESQLAAISEGYIKQTLAAVLQKSYKSHNISIESRNYFNEANESVWFLMSGQYVSILTLMCVFLGSFAIAREWDRGTFESLCATNASALDIVLAKVIVYYVLALMTMFVILSLGQVLYDIPIRGNILYLLVSLSVYALEMICLGLLISAKLKNQFTATQIAVVIGFLPTVMLSGLIFDLRAVQPFIAVIGHIIPPTYEVKAMRINIMSGGQELYLLKNLLIQIAWTIVFFTLTVRQVKKDGK